MNIDQTKIEQAVTEQAVASLVETLTDHDHEIASTIRNKASELILKRVNQAIDDEILRVVQGGLEEIMFPCTNAYGEAKRPDRTLKEFIAEKVNEVFTEYVDGEGRPTKDSWHTRDPKNRRVIRIVDAAVKSKIQDDITAAANTVKTTINNHIAEFIKIQLNELTAKLK
jgi:hypothetical protein